MNLEVLSQEAVQLLQSLIKVQSYSGEEQRTGDILQKYFIEKGIPTERIHNNIIVKSKGFENKTQKIILNSHHDTVAIGNGWTEDPLGAIVKAGKLYGRGSNDAGGSLVALITIFIALHRADLPFGIMLIASGEEENSGPKGVSAVLSQLDFIPDLAIIGEPTEMHLAIAEKGLIVIDGEVRGVSGHAARDVGDNAIYKAQKDILAIQEIEWDRISSVLGRTKSTVTQIQAGSQHNVIPDRCSYVVDCRVNEHYTLQEVVDILDQHTLAELKPRSLRWHPSGIDNNHPIVRRGIQLNRNIFGSPTLSDQVHFSCPSIKIGPGRSERSHTSDEFIKIREIKEGIDIYYQLLTNLELP